MNFKDLVGKTFDFYGVDNNEFKLNNIVFEAIEDEDDGWRSYLDSIVVIESKGIFFNNPLAKVKIEDYDDGHNEGFKLIDIEDNHVWLEVGTDDYDDWYPYFVFRYQPKEKR